MAFQTGGSFAGGFMTAFLAAQRLNMQKRHYKVMDDYYNALMGKINDPNKPSAVAQTAHDAVLNNPNPSYGGRRDTGATGATKSGYAVPANNNPGNLEANPWTRSLPGYKGSDGRFAIFDTPENGTAAAARNIGSKASQASTLRQLTNIWAPKGDGANDPDAYAETLAKGMGVSADDKVNFADPQIQQKLVPLIAGVEHGGQTGFTTAPGQFPPPATAAPAQAIPTAPLPPPRPVTPAAVTPQGNPPAPQTAIPPVAIPSDQASNDQSSMGAAKGGPVKRQSYSQGGVVKAYDLGGSTADEDEDSQNEAEDQQEMYMLNRSTGTPGATNGTPLLEQPPTSAIPTQAQDASAAANGTQVASANPYGMGGLPRIGAGLGGSGMRMGGGRMPGGRGGLGGSHDDPTSYYAGDNERSPGVPEIADQDGNLASGAAAALTGGLRFLSKFVGGQPGGIPGDSNQANAHQEFAGAGASREEMAQLHQAVNPNNTLKGAMADIAGLEATHQWYIQHGMPVEADKAAAGIMMAARNASANWGDQAVKEIYGGNSEKAIEAIKKGYDAIPDGGTLDVVDNKDGSYTVSQKNMHRRVTWQGTVGPSEIMSAAIGLKDGSMAWKLMGEAARKFDPQGQAEAQQVSPGTQAEIAKLYGGGGGGQAPPQQGIPTTTPAAATGPAPAPVPAQVTSKGNPPAQPVNATPPNPFAGRPIPAQITSGQAIPTNPNAPAPGASEAGFNIPDLPQSVLDAHQRNLDGQLSQLQAQILGPAIAMRPPVNIEHLNSLPEGSADRKAYVSAVQDATKQWQQDVYAPAKARYDQEEKSLRDQNLSDLTSARQAIRTEAENQRADARAKQAADMQNQRLKQSADLQDQRLKQSADLQDIRSKQTAALQDKRLRSNADLQEQRDTDLANRGFQREVVNRQIPSGSDLEKLRDSTDTTTLPTAFGGDAYNTQFKPEEREGIRNATVELGRLNNLPADTASHIAAKIILDPADDDKDAAYKVTPMKNFAGGASGTFVKLTPQKPSPNLPEVVMPASHYMNLITTRNQLSQRVDMAKTTATERGYRDEGRETRASSFQDRLEKKLAAPQGVTPKGNYVPVLDRPPGVPVSDASPGVLPGVPPAKYIQPRLQQGIPTQ